MAPMTILLYWKGIVDASGARTCQVGTRLGRLSALEGRTRFPAVCIFL